MVTAQTTLNHFQRYVYKPYYRQSLTDRPGNTIPETIRSFLAEYPMILILLLLSTGITLLVHYTTGQDVYKSIIQRLGSSMGVSLVALPLAVILEEAVFRAILRLTPNRLRNVIALLVWVPLGYYYHTIKELTNEFALLWLVPIWVIVASLLGRYLKQPTVFRRIDAFWQANFRSVFYSISLLYVFGKMISNVDMPVDDQILLLPLFLLAGVINSLYFGYVRMTYGFWYAVAVHTLMVIAALTPEVIRVL